MLYAQARYYDPRNGRFNAEDTVRDGLNWYEYARSNPLRFVDKNGLWCEDVLWTDMPQPPINNSTHSPQPYSWVPNAVNASIKKLQGLVSLTKPTNFSTYRGETVADMPLLWSTINGDRAFAFNWIFVPQNRYISETTMDHEWGHLQQQRELDPLVYLLGIGHPSASAGISRHPWSVPSEYIHFYYSKPWERAADILGGVDRQWMYVQGEGWQPNKYLYGSLPISILYNEWLRKGARVRDLLPGGFIDTAVKKVRSWFEKMIKYDCFE